MSRATDRFWKWWDKNAWRFELTERGLVRKRGGDRFKSHCPLSLYADDTVCCLNLANVDKGISDRDITTIVAAADALELTDDESIEARERLLGPMRALENHGHE